MKGRNGFGYLTSASLLIRICFFFCTLFKGEGVLGDFDFLDCFFGVPFFSLIFLTSFFSYGLAEGEGVCSRLGVKAVLLFEALRVGLGGGLLDFGLLLFFDVVINFSLLILFKACWAFDVLTRGC